MNELIHWLFGPQLVGLVMLIAGYIQKASPPKKVNELYGYRTQSSMRNQQTWDLGNSYAAQLMINMGFIAIVIGLLLTRVIDMKHEYFMGVATVVAAIAIAIILRQATENKLKNTFDKDGNAIL